MGARRHLDVECNLNRHISRLRCSNDSLAKNRCGGVPLGLKWRLFFENEPSVLVRQACIARIMDQEGREAVPFALQQLANPDWRIRAAAVEGLLSLGEWGIRAASTLLPGS